jgi:hypothetical protein
MPQRSLYHILPRKMRATREETCETRKVTNVTMSHFGGKARKKIEIRLSYPGIMGVL